MVEKENGAASTGLPSANFRENVIDFFFEGTITDNDPVVIHFVPTLSQDLSKMVGVGRFHVNKIVFAIKMYGLNTFSIKPVSRLG